MKYIASCSFGKDSLAQIIVAMQYGRRIDEVIYSEVMFTKEISGEIPEHRDFIYNIAIPTLKKRFGLDTTVLRSTRTMWDDFHTVRVRGESAGKIRGFPIPGLCTINRDIKIQPIRAYLKDQGEITQYVGIASDETERLKRLVGTNKTSLLAIYDITESKALELCKNHGLLSPIYRFTKRNGCFFCPNASMQELRHIYYSHPDLWFKLRELQETPNKSRDCFTRSKTIFDLEKQFWKEERRKQNECS